MLHSQIFKKLFLASLIFCVNSVTIYGDFTLSQIYFFKFNFFKIIYDSLKPPKYIKKSQ